MIPLVDCSRGDNWIGGETGGPEAPGGAPAGGPVAPGATETPAGGPVWPGATDTPGGGPVWPGVGVTPAGGPVGLADIFGRCQGYVDVGVKICYTETMRGRGGMRLKR